MHGRQHQPQRGVKRLYRRNLFLVLDSDVVDARLARPACAAIGDVKAHAHLQFERDMLDDVAEIGAAVQAFDKAARPADTALVLVQGGQPANQAIHKAGKAAARPFVIGADVHDGVQHRHIGI